MIFNERNILLQSSDYPSVLIQNSFGLGGLIIMCKHKRYLHEVLVTMSYCRLWGINFDPKEVAMSVTKIKQKKTKTQANHSLGRLLGAKGAQNCLLAFSFKHHCAYCGSQSCFSAVASPN